MLASNEAIAADPLFANAKEQMIVDPVTYDDWFDGVDDARRKLAVGARRFSVVNERIGGNARWSNFVEPQTGRLLTTDELTRETAAERTQRVSEVEALIADRRRATREVATFGFELPEVPKVEPLTNGNRKQTPTSREKEVRGWLEQPHAKTDRVDPVPFLKMSQKTIDKLADKFGLKAKTGHDLYLEVSGALERAKAGTPFRLPIKHQLAEYEEGDKKLAKIANFTVKNQKLHDKAAEIASTFQDAMNRRATEPTLDGKDRLMDEAIRLNKEHDKVLKAIKKHREQEIAQSHKALAIDSKSQVPVEWHAMKFNLEPTVEKRVNDAHAFMKQVVAKKPGEQEIVVSFMHIKPEQEQRDFHMNMGDKKSLVMLSHDTSAKTVAHEWGHSIEIHNPGALDAAKKFLAHRVKDEPLKKLADVGPGHGYKDDEMGRDDEFGKYFTNPAHARYVGKDYGGRATEVISMGVEALYNDPVNFAKKDPEYCKFIMGILDGTLR